jgi:uncharacterized SAM-binding protein YcdF (DUF218 family)
VHDYIVIFGAAVRANGKPSLALRRRIDRAAALARAIPTAMIMPTGGTGEHGPAEAKVMRRALIEAGVARRRIVIEPNGRDTLESVRMCNRALRERGDCGRVIICTSGYHQLRCAMLFRLLGWRVQCPQMTRDTGRVRRRTYGRMIVRELFALPYDALLLLTKRSLQRA